MKKENDPVPVPKSTGDRKGPAIGRYPSTHLNALKAGTFPYLRENILKSDEPPWRPISSRRLAALLKVSLQVLANWRVRESGPPPEARKRGTGNRLFYRPDKVLAWLSADEQDFWEFDRDWLAIRDLTVHNPCEVNIIAFAAEIDRQSRKPL